MTLCCYHPLDWKSLMLIEVFTRVVGRLTVAIGATMEEAWPRWKSGIKRVLSYDSRTLQTEIDNRY